MKNNLTLLYAEDDDIIRENFTHIFQTYFANVITTDDGDEALKLYKENSVDIAILDIQLNGLDGISLATKIREQNSETVLLIISAYSDTEKLLKAINLKLFGYLIKPVLLKELTDVIKNIIDSFKEVNLIQLNKDYSWDTSANTLHSQNSVIKLTKNETLTIQALVENRNHYMSACDIQEEMFSDKFSDQQNCNNVVQLLSRLKKKLDDEHKEYFIENCYGMGYRINID